MDSHPHIMFICSMRSSFEQRLLKAMARRALAAGWVLRWGGPILAAQLAAKFSGVMTFALNKTDLAEVLRSGLPAVSVSSRNLGCGLPCVTTDDAAIGAAAVDHFSERQFQSFAFVGSHQLGFSQRRQAGFMQALGDRTCAVHNINDYGGYQEANNLLETFLLGLPPMTAVFTASDIYARRVCSAGLSVGLRIPDDLAVLGVDADELISMSSTVPLSSVDSNPDAIGYQAACLLERIMAAKDTKTLPPISADHVECVPPSQVVSARSTDALASTDDLVRRASAIMRERACEGLRVQELAKACGCNRRTLELRFFEVTGGGIAERLRSIRIERSKALLTTGLTIAEIAERTGFCTPAYYSSAFKKAVGLPPAQYRSQVLGFIATKREIGVGPL